MLYSKEVLGFIELMVTVINAEGVRTPISVMCSLSGIVTFLMDLRAHYLILQLLHSVLLFELINVKKYISILI